MKTIRKGIEEEIVDGFDWSDRLEQGESIASSDWIIDTGLTGLNGTYDSTSTEIELTGGDENEQYKCQNEITTSTGQVMQRSFKVMVVER